MDSMELGMNLCLGLTAQFDYSGMTNLRFAIRPWGNTAAEAAMAVSDAHGRRVAKGHSWIDVFLRVNDDNGIPLEFPPRSTFYNGLDCPDEIDPDQVDGLMDGLLARIQQDVLRGGRL